jgi:ADP-ribosyl-[dinitrogen reductase] hydrolase
MPHATLTLHSPCDPRRPACYISSSLPVVLFFAYRHATQPDSADAATHFGSAAFDNTNAGGENCHRGSALGALMGAMAGSAVPAALKEGLYDSKDIAAEIDTFVASLTGPATQCS